MQDWSSVRFQLVDVLLCARARVAPARDASYLPLTVFFLFVFLVSLSAAPSMFRVFHVSCSWRAPRPCSVFRVFVCFSC